MSDGGPAFPRTGVGEAGIQYDVPSQDGMSLRDYFAGQIAAGVLVHGYQQGLDSEQDDLPDLLAAATYKLADAMLRARQPERTA